MKTKDIVQVALFAALSATLGFFPPINMPIASVPITLQSLGVMLSGSILGGKKGALAQLLFLSLTAAGLPLLAGGRGGISCFLGGSGGFLLTWPISTFLTGWLFEKYWTKLSPLLATLFITFGCILVLYTAGILWLNFVLQIPLQQAFFGCWVFIPGDLVKVAIATSVSLAIKKHYPLIHP